MAVLVEVEVGVLMLETVKMRVGLVEVKDIEYWVLF